MKEYKLNNQIYNAIQWKSENLNDVVEFCNYACDIDNRTNENKTYLQLQTLNGDIQVGIGDYITKDSFGRFEVYSAYEFEKRFVLKAKAKTIFKSLGFTEKSDLLYERDDGGYITTIHFLPLFKTVRFEEYETYNDNLPQGNVSMSLELLEAINLKLHELGWKGE